MLTRACECAYESGPGYIAFNFDDANDHEYLEDNLVYIGVELNKILGRHAFYKYEADGTDDSVFDYH